MSRLHVTSPVSQISSPVVVPSVADTPRLPAGISETGRNSSRTPRCSRRGAAFLARGSLFCGACFLVLMALWGCRAEQLRVDHTEMRQSLLRMYEDQLMDNLIRARDDLPFIQLDYSNVTAVVTDSGSGNAGGSTTVVNTGFAKNAATGAGAGTASFAPNHVITDLFSYNGSGSQTNQLTLTAQPYTASNAVYDAYVSFAKDERLLVKGQKGQKPPEDAHMSRMREGVVYWVPKEAAPEFLRLYLTTTVYRQAPANIPTSYQSTVKGMVSPAESIAGTPGFKITLRLADKIPNDSGNLTLTVNGVETTFRVMPVSDVRAGTSTDRLVLIYDPAAVKNLSPDDFVKEAAGKAVSIHLNNYAPGYKAPPVNDTEPIRSELERLRLNSFIK